MSWQGKQETNRRLKKLYEKTNNGWGAGVYFDEKKNRYIRYSPSDHSTSTSYYKKHASKKVRKRDDLLQRGTYKKVFDYSWTIW